MRPALPDGVVVAVTALKGSLVERFGQRLRDLRLFGSYARGDAHAESDVDVLVVIEGLSGAEKLELYGVAADLYPAHRLRISPLALSPEELEELQRRELLIATELARDGVPL